MNKIIYSSSDMYDLTFTVRAHTILDIVNCINSIFTITNVKDMINENTKEVVHNDVDNSYMLDKDIMIRVLDKFDSSLYSNISKQTNCEIFLTYEDELGSFDMHIDNGIIKKY